jgi:hypothetical protein
MNKQDKLSLLLWGLLALLILSFCVWDVIRYQPPKEREGHESQGQNTQRYSVEVTEKMIHIREVNSYDNN